MPNLIGQWEKYENSSTTINRNVAENNLGHFCFMIRFILVLSGYSVLGQSRDDSLPSLLAAGGLRLRSDQDGTGVPQSGVVDHIC